MKKIIILLCFLPFFGKSQTINEFKFKVDTSITNKTAAKSITAVGVGSRIKELADLLGVKRDSILGIIDGLMRYTDTVNLSNRINLKFNTADTINKWLAVGWIPALMKYTDTASLSSRIDLKVNVNDTSNRWVSRVYKSNDSLFYTKGGNNTFIGTFTSVVAWDDITGKPSTFPPSSGSGDYIQNQRLVRQSAGFNIDDTATVGVLELVNTFATLTINPDDQVINFSDGSNDFEWFFPTGQGIDDYQDLSSTLATQEWANLQRVSGIGNSTNNNLVLDGSRLGVNDTHPFHNPITSKGPNGVPFNSAYPLNRRQYLYKPNDLKNGYSGNILVLRCSTSVQNTAVSFDSLTVYIGNTTSTEFTSPTQAWIGGLTLVRDGSFSGTTDASGWLTIPLQTPFFWNGTSNFVVDFSKVGSPGFSIIQTSGLTNRSILGGKQNTNATSRQSNLGVIEFQMDRRQIVRVADDTFSMDLKAPILTANRELLFPDESDTLATRSYARSVGGGADSTVFYTVYRSDTSRRNIYNAIGGKINGNGTLSNNEVAAINGANSPSSGNVFLTQADVAGGLPTGQIPTGRGGKTTPQSITSGTFVDVTGLTASVTLASSVPVYAMCTYDATESGGGGSSIMEVRMIIDGDTSQTVTVDFANKSNTSGSINFRTAGNLPTGSYTVIIQARQVSGSKTPSIDAGFLFAQAQQAPKGDAGEGLPVGGIAGEVPIKQSGVDYDIAWGLPTKLGIVSEGIWQGDPIAEFYGGLPPGGTTSQMLVKSTDDDYNTEWQNQPDVPDSFAHYYTIYRSDTSRQNIYNAIGTKISGNQTITLSGDVSGTGATAITTTIGAAKVTNTMLAGSIANAKLSNSTISGVALGSNLNDLTIGTNLQLSSGSTYNGSAARTLSLQDASTSAKGAAQFSGGQFKASSGIITFNTDYQALSDGATITLNANTSPNGWVVLGGNRHLTVSNPVIGGVYFFKVIQDGTGSRTITGVGKGAITINGGANDTTKLAVEYDNHGSWTWTCANCPGGGGGSVNSVAATAPAAGFTISGSPITNSGTFTFALANDLAAVEGLSSNGIATRTGTDTWAVRTIMGTTNKISVTNGDGVSGNPTIDVGSDIVQLTSTQTLTNKRVSPRFENPTAGSSLTPDADANDQVNLIPNNTTTTINAPSGTPTGSQKLILRLIPNTTITTLNWNAAYREVGATLPASLVSGKVVYVGLIRNATNSVWDVVAVAIQP